MASLDSIVSVTVLTTSPGITRAGFGTPMILTYKPGWVERTRTYTDPDDLLADGFVTADPEYKAAVAACSQTPRPDQFILGRCVNKPTMKYRVDVVTVANVYDYKIVTSFGTANYSSDSSAENDEIVTGLVAALNALVGKNYTAAPAGVAPSTYIEVTATNAGDWFSLEVPNLNMLSNALVHDAPDVAADLAAIKVENDTWYSPITLFNSSAYILAVAAWVQTNEKLYGPASPDSTIVTEPLAGGTDVASEIHSASYTRTFPFYYPSPDKFADAALMGRQLPLDPGSETWKFITLAGVPTVDLTTTQITNGTDKNAMLYYRVGAGAGVGITAEGKVGSGEWIDVIRFIDWLRVRLQEDVFTLFKGQSDLGKKVPFSAAGFAMIENVTRARLDDGVAVGGLTTESVIIDGRLYDPGPAVKVPTVASVPLADRQARKLTGVKFAGKLAGAVHAAEITGTVTN